MPRELPDFYVDVLEELGVTAPDRTASAEDVLVVRDAYPAIWAMLYERELANFGSEDKIPDKALLPMRWIVAFHIAPVFGVTGEKLRVLQDRGQVEGPSPSLGERLLRKQNSPDYIPSTVQSLYF